MSAEYKKQLHIVSDVQGDFIKKCGEDTNKNMELLLKEIGELNSIFTEEKFSEGFILGAKLMIEILTDTRFSK